MALAHRNSLLRILGFAFGLAVVVGSVIGQGILRSPGVVAQASDRPEVLLALWALGAGIAALSALAFAELGTAIPRAGGTFAFVERAFGEKAGAFAGLCALVGFMTSLAMMCFILGEFLGRLGVGGASMGPASLGLICLLLFCCLNAAGTRISGASLVGLSAAKAVVLLVLIVALLAQGKAAAAPAPAPVEPGLPAFATALMVITNTYSGWHHLTYYGEELRNPGRDVPRSLFAGIVGVAVLYLLVNFAMIRVLGPSRMAGSILPAADAAGVVFGPGGEKFLTLFGILSVGAIANLFVMSSSRIAFALARAGTLPAVLARVEKNGTPLLAMLFVSAVVAVFILTGSYLSLVTTTSAITQFNMVVSLAALGALRRNEPGLDRPYRVPAYPWTWLAAFAISILLMAVFVARDPFHALLGFALVGALWLADLGLRRVRRGRLERREALNGLSRSGTDFGG